MLLQIFPKHTFARCCALHSDVVVHGVVCLSVHLVLVVFILLIASLLLVGGHSLVLGWMLGSTAVCLGLDLYRDMGAG